MVYGCSFVARGPQHPQSELSFGFDEPARFKALWQDDHLWSFFRECDPGKCALEKEARGGFFEMMHRLTVDTGQRADTVLSRSRRR